MNALNVTVVGLEDVSKYWLECETLIERGLAAGEGETNAANVLKDIRVQHAYLVVGLDPSNAVKAAMVVQFMKYPNYTIATVYAISGRGVIENAHQWVNVKAWMRQHGATKVQGICKPAQARLWRKLGFQAAYQTMRQDL